MIPRDIYNFFQNKIKEKHIVNHIFVMKSELEHRKKFKKCLKEIEEIGHDMCHFWNDPTKETYSLVFFLWTDHHTSYIPEDNGLTIERYWEGKTNFQEVKKKWEKHWHIWLEEMEELSEPGDPFYILKKRLKN